MKTLYEVVKHNGRWGFWCDAFEEKRMLELVKSGNRVVGGFVHPELGARRVMAVGGDRKEIIASLPKTRIFFAFNPAHDDIDESWPIDWVGHIGCFPYLSPRSIMLQTCNADVVIAKGEKPYNEGGMWVSVIEILPGIPIPPTSCCDM